MYISSGSASWKQQNQQIEKGSAESGTCELVTGQREQNEAQIRETARDVYLREMYAWRWLCGGTPGRVEVLAAQT